LGNFVGDITPRFVSRLASVDAVVTQAFTQYASEVRGGQFPAPKHCYSLDASESLAVATAL
jgi:ketopantoate hydroxymethyltransferase